MYKLEFTLKQHTPLIHFQSDQVGATLRATDVKPKLDQYLLEKLTGKRGFDARIEFHQLIFSDDQEWKKRKEWLNGSCKDLKKEYAIQSERDLDLSHIAFNYKLSLQCNDNKKGEIQEVIYQQNGNPNRNNENKIKVKTFPCFFGNNGNENIEEFKWFSWTDKVNARFIIFDENLKGIIDKYFFGFIFHSNFGTRSTKGFGSYTVLNEKGQSRKPKDASKYYFDLDYPVINNNQKNGLISRYNNFGYGIIEPQTAEYLMQNKFIFSQIDLLYRAMRSGINIPNQNPIPCSNDSRFYLKSFLFYYFKEKFNVQWDKKSIKEYFYLNSNCFVNQRIVNTDPDNPINYSATLPVNSKKNIRDLLGLSTEQNWMSYNLDTITKASTIRENNLPLYARFASPVIFKPVRFAQKVRIYIEYKEFPSELCGKSFDIKSHNNLELNPLTLTFPDSFDIKDYLFFLFEEKNGNGNYLIDLENYIEPDYQSDDETSEFYKLSTIFESIRNNLNNNE